MVAAVFFAMYFATGGLADIHAELKEFTVDAESAP
jgi:hypothetical protein